MFHVRRGDKEICDEGVLRRVLGCVKFVTVAMCRGGEPYLVSLSCGYDVVRNCLFFHCAGEGKKLVFLSGSGRVWGQALLDFGYVEGECDHRFACVHFCGSVTFLESVDEKRAAVECMIRQLDKHPERLIDKLGDERLEKAVIGRIDIEYMSGKKSKDVDV
jgi:nitroimidazol reductase NimA-like FMN-containing flavoprotein (pyridoxamine 5'-phosphate oxidase superfamily)